MARELARQSSIAMAKPSKPAGEPVITDEVRKVADLTTDPRNARRHSEAQSLGFGPAELKRILDEPDDLMVHTIETGPVDDEFWISIRGPLAKQADALKALEAAMKPFAGVTVEQGTINIG